MSKRGRPKQDLCRVTMNLPPHIVEALQAYADEKGVNRTTATIWILASQLGDYVKKDDPPDENQERIY